MLIKEGFRLCKRRRSSFLRFLSRMTGRSHFCMRILLLTITMNNSFMSSWIRQTNFETSMNWEPSLDKVKEHTTTWPQELKIWLESGWTSLLLKLHLTKTTWILPTTSYSRRKSILHGTWFVRCWSRNRNTWSSNVSSSAQSSTQAMPALKRSNLLAQHLHHWKTGQSV